LAQTSSDKTDNRFPLAIFDQPIASDLDVSVRFAGGGRGRPAAAGIAIRLSDANNLLRRGANALEDNVRLWVVRASASSSPAPTPRYIGCLAGAAPTARGPRFEVFPNGKSPTPPPTSRRCRGQGRAWTKSDSVTYFGRSCREGPVSAEIALFCLLPSPRPSSRVCMASPSGWSLRYSHC
jgi:hypothetical protein